MQKRYEERIAFRLLQSSRRCTLMCRGTGVEPRLDFTTNSLEFGPALPHSTNEEHSIVVRNPCDFPIEFYNVEFDKLYLEEASVCTSSFNAVKSTSIYSLNYLYLYIDLIEQWPLDKVCVDSAFMFYVLLNSTKSLECIRVYLSL